MTVLRTSLRVSLGPRNFPPWDWPKDVLTSVSSRPKSWCHKWYLNTHNTHTPFHLWENSTAPTQEFVQALTCRQFGCVFLATKAAWNRALDNPKFPKSQFPRQITSWLPSRNPPLPRTWTAACTAISLAAIQPTIWWEKMRERNIVLKHGMLQLVFCLITEHFWPLPELQSLLELQSFQNRKNKLSLLFVMVRIS